MATSVIRDRWPVTQTLRDCGRTNYRLQGIFRRRGPLISAARYGGPAEAARDASVWRRRAVVLDFAGLARFRCDGLAGAGGRMFRRHT